MDIAISLIGGLGLFLFGMNYMGDGLQKAAGNKMKNLLAALTKNNFTGLLVGTLVTAVIQSSSATTVMTIGFVNAGLMNLNQAIGIIMGANIGTTTTALLVSLDITKLATLFVGIGVFVYLSSKKKKIKNIAEVIIGFGILFVGMDLMKSAMEPMKNSSLFIDAMTKFTNPLLGILVGFSMTAILQSSSATTGLLIALSASGGVTLGMAYPVIFGQNIGTCVTAMLSSIGANKTAKRAAVIHLLFNIIGTLIFIIFLSRPIQALVLEIVPSYVPKQIAVAHILFNIINVIILFPFSKYLVRASEIIVKGGNEDDKENVVKYIDQRLLATPPIALTQASKELLRLGRMVQNQFEISSDAFVNKNETSVYEVFEIEKRVNALTKLILEYLVKLDKESLTDDEKDKLVTMMNTLNDLERVGDHADNIAELALYKIENNVSFSESANQEFMEMYDLTNEVFELSLDALSTIDCDDCHMVLNRDKEIDNMFKLLRKNHIDRLNNRICEPNSGVIFLDTISNLERIGDHSSNIAITILEVINKKNKIIL
ncbi:phosphate:Na+ symporter [Sedimentibacter acidaminivorans]|uniref:Phosphate:Na+ symporter n=1 Tax=Sedimentibacter acidaminivorans TaxID=913099 RepID=A0ABS4GCZ1_9FIRM|nr:Na/Pi cotransporter family protein [Sedimentibacter acidaminivorans]MBP1925549.1 phosphate:Na+ symporter [Sedimentibacter acidaminivorans]